LPDLLCVDPKDVHQIWPHAKELIRRLSKRPISATSATLNTTFCAAISLLWLAISDHVEAAATTHLIKTKDKTCVDRDRVCGREQGPLVAV
jgi:hypothetical protein